MNGSTTNDSSEDRGKPGCQCPFCALMEMVDCARKRHGSFFHHLSNAEISALLRWWKKDPCRLRAQSTICGAEAHRKRATRIEVE